MRVLILVLLLSLGLSAQQKDFEYNGKPIHPGLVAQFLGWISDSGTPITVAVDVAAASDTNQYYDGDVSVKDGIVSAKLESYRWLGRLEDGTHLVQTFSQADGGTGVFESLLFLTFSRSQGQKADGSSYDRLVMSVKRSYPLGDRATVQARLKGNTVTLAITDLQGQTRTVTLTDR